jgi:hypothetical protein
MKTKAFLGIVAAWCGLLTSAVGAQPNPSPTSPTPPAQSMEEPAKTPGRSSSSNSPMASPAPGPTPEKEKPAESSVRLSSSLAASRAAEEARRAHILPTAGPFKMETPPPAPRAETKSPAPAAGYVWIPGHWTPVKGQWQWTPGEWATPATAASVWIEARYDSKTKEWTAGYWQPDRPDSYEPEIQKETTAPGPPTQK